MKRQTLNICAVAVGIGCLIGTSAHAQRGGRQNSRGVQSSRSATTQSGANGSNGQSSGQGGCQNGGSQSSTSATTTAGTGTSATTTANSTVAAQSQQIIGRVTAQRVSTSTAVVQWSGATANVQKVYLAVLDSNGTVVSQTAVAPNRAQANLTLSGTARYYGAMVVYADGTSKTTYTQVR